MVHRIIKGVEKKMNKLKTIVRKLCVVIVCLLLIENTCYIQVEAKEDNAVPTGNESLVGNMHVEVFIDNYWQNSYNARVRITNIGDDIVHNWCLATKTNDSVTGLYNAIEISGFYNDLDSSVKLFKNNGYNQDIEPGTYVEFGFTGKYMSSSDVPCEFENVTSGKTTPINDYLVNKQIVSQWGSGAIGNIEIKNISKQTLEDWTIEFDTKAEILEVWNGKMLSNDNGHVIITNPAYNQNIGSNNSIVIGVRFGKDFYSGINNTILDTVMVSDISLIFLDYEKDSDGDEIPDVFENEYGTNPKQKDTDEDGLTDYEELFVTLTDPLVYDSVISGVADVDADIDGDGFTNKQELEMGTDPYFIDTDFDGINDDEEISVYKTNPIEPDTDKDTLSDGDELTLGLNPLKKDSDDDGIEDSEEIITQEVQRDNYDDAIFENNVAIPSITVNAKGNVNNTIAIEEVPNYRIGDERAFIGKGIRIINAPRESGKIVFSLPQDYVFNKYVLGEAETQGLLIQCNKEDGGESISLNTIVDETNKTLSADLVGDGIYYILNIPGYMNIFGYNMPTDETVVLDENGYYVDINSITSDTSETVEVMLEENEEDDTIFEKNDIVSEGSEDSISTWEEGTEEIILDSEDYDEEENIPKEDLIGLPMEAESENNVSEMIQWDEESEKSIEFPSMIEKGDTQINEESEQNIVSTKYVNTEYATLQTLTYEDPTEYRIISVDSIGDTNDNPNETEYENDNNPTSYEMSGESVKKVNAVVDIVFVIDTTGSMGSVVDNTQKYLSEFTDKLQEEGINASYGLVDYKDITTSNGNVPSKIVKNGYSNWFTTTAGIKSMINNSLYIDGGGDGPECALDGLATAKSVGFRANAQKFIILVTDADNKNDNVFGYNSIDEIADEFKNKEICVSVIAPDDVYCHDCYDVLCDKTDGIYCDIYGDYLNQLLKIADKIKENSEGYWIALDTPVPTIVKLNERPAIGSIVDTDLDGVSDIEELGNCDTAIKKVGPNLILGMAYGSNKQFNYEELDVYSFCSHPDKVDSDSDGMSDKWDSEPENPAVGMILYRTKDNIDVYKNSTLAQRTGTVNKDIEDYQYGNLSLDEVTDGSIISKLDAKKSDTKLLQDMRKLFSRYMTKENEKIGENMVTYFASGNGKIYRDFDLTTLVQNDQNSIEYLEQIQTILDNYFSYYGNDFSGLVFDESNRNNSQLISTIKDSQGNYIADGMQDKNGNVIVFKPNINDTLSTRIVMDTVTEVKIELVSYDEETGDYKLRITYYDIFGLNLNDMKLKVAIQGGFKAWYILQHYDIYKGQYVPFIDETTFVVDGKVNK